MKLAWCRLLALSAIVVGGLLVAPVATGPFKAAALGQDLFTEDNAISGTMDIDYKTRTELDEDGDFIDGSSKKGAKDTYTLNLTVAQTTLYSGKVTRQPELLSRILRKQEQKPQLEYNITLSVRNPKNLDEKKTVGKWVGTVPLNPANGLYDMAGGAKAESPLRIATDAIGTTSASNDRFGGKMYGKSKKEDSFTAYSYKRLIGNKTVELKVSKVDPMRFNDLELAKGPTGNYPHTTVNGRLDYDYETGNWLTDGLKFRYSLNGKDTEDTLTGSIKWVEDDNRKTNGKGFYDFNLRFNESKNKPAGNEADAFAKLSDEEAFFAVDDTIPCLTGKVSYVDTFISGTDSPAKSKVTYELNANKLTKTQLVNFFKLWMVGVGPINDE